MRSFFIKSIVLISIVSGLIFSADASAAPLPSEVSVDYSYYNPLSLVIKKFNWLEKEFETDRVPIRWVFTPGSNLALKYLKDDSVNISSSASLSSVLSKAYGYRIKSVYVFARPEWAALLVNRDSPINSVNDLKGKRIAVTPGTDPYFFLLRALREAGMHKEDVEIVPLQHTDGRTALERKKVDAWSGLHPYAGMSQLENGSREIYRNVFFNSYGVLNVSEDFAKKYPEAVLRVLFVYEKARKWALRHPDDLDAIYAEEVKVPLAVSRLVLSRYDFFNPVIDRNDMSMLRAASRVLKNERLISSDTDLDKVIPDLVDRDFILNVISADSNLSR
jgi:sulfonate transport system substrate-binding protein